MTTKELYCVVSSDAPADASGFLDALARSVAFLRARYGDEAISDAGRIPSSPATLDGECGIDGIFDEALRDYTVFCINGDESRRNAALVAADYAYRTLWRRRCAGVRVRKEMW